MKTYYLGKTKIMRWTPQENHRATDISSEQ